MQHQDRRRRFELMTLPHLDAAYNLARWLAGNPSDAEDVVQDAYLRAFRYYDPGRHYDGRVWLLAIVRHSFADWARQNRAPGLRFSPDAPEDARPLWSEPPDDAETMLRRQGDGATVARLMETLPPEYREVLVLREVEELSYRDIARVAGVPQGTVMSRLSRARDALRRLWHDDDARQGGG